MFDGVARHYDRTNAIMSVGNAQLWRAATVRAVDPQAGRAHPRCRRRHRHVVRPPSRAPAPRVVALDFSPGMIAEGRARHPKHRVRRGRRREAAVRRRRVRRRHHQLRPAQRRAPEGRARRDVPGAQARRPPRDLRVLASRRVRVFRAGYAAYMQVRDAGRRRPRQLEPATPTATCASRSSSGPTRARSASGSAASGSPASPTATSPPASSPCTAATSPDDAVRASIAKRKSTPPSPSDDPAEPSHRREAVDP